MAKRISIILICFVLIFSLIGYTYATTDDLENQKSSIQSEINQTEKELNEVKNEKKTAMEEVTSLTEQIAQGQAEINEIDNQLEELDKQIEQIKAELQEAEDKYTEQEKMLESRLVAQYKKGKTSYLDVLLKSDGLQSFLSKYKYITMIAQYDTDLLKEMEEQRIKIEETKKQLEEKETEVKVAKANKEKANVLLKNSKALKDSYVSQLSANEQELQKQIEEKNAELAKVNSQIKQIEQTAVIQDANYTKYIGGTMAWPTRIGKYVTSVYAPGGRSDSSWAGTAHKGVDINAPQGTAIYAAADGVVVYVNSSGYGGGWGLYVVISHGNGIYTRYAHGSAIASGISVGSTVTTDTVIMYSGSTGMANGAHLHFEVCQGSIYNQVNPCPYLGIENRYGAL